ncbi:MAG: transglycosylase SLT domain-containing protein [Oligoflexia bacterium]|nr:transglycosylase SLT domain-containing protein [Oligoflexia bacterium]
MRTPALLMGLILFLAQGAQGANDVPSAPQPIDVLQEKLRAPRKNRVVQALKKAYDFLQEGKTVAARKAAEGVARDPVFGDYAQWILAAANFEEARAAFDARKWRDVERPAQSSIAATAALPLRYPYSPLLKQTSREIAQAELLSGAAACAMKSFASCRDRLEAAFQRLSAMNDFGTIRPEFLETYGLACTKKPGPLCEAWQQRLVGFYPKNSAETKALLANSTGLERRSPPGHARATRAYKAPDLDYAAFDAAMASYFDQKYGDAAKAFRQFLDDFPRSTYRYRAQYWLAQALSQQQKHDDARKILENLQNSSPLTYYGMLAAISSGRNLGEPIDGAVPAVRPTDPFLSPQEIRRLSRAELLLANQADELAAMELKDFRPRDAHSSPFLLYLAMLDHEAGNHSLAFTILTELFQRSYEGVYSTYVLRLIFPVEHLELIEKYALENKLDPILVLSLIKQESGFESRAASGAGAQGLMQLMPATAADVFPELSRVELIAVEANIRTGTRYLGKLLARFNGNITLALAAYNAGPGAVDRWVKATAPQRGMLEFIESIPYKETREYVAAIIRNYFWYSRSLNWESQKTLAYFWNVYGPPEAPAPVIPPPPVPTDAPSEE